MTRAQEIKETIEKVLPDLDFALRPPKSEPTKFGQRHLWEVEVLDDLEPHELVELLVVLPNFTISSEIAEVLGSEDHCIVLWWYE